MDNYITPEVITGLIGFGLAALGYFTGVIIRKAISAARASKTKLDDYIVGAAEDAIENLHRK